MLSAYVDAGTQENRILTVAAVAFGPDRAKKASAQWAKVWSDTVCHMTDLNSRRGDFAGWDAARVDSVFRRSIEIVDSFASFCVVASCDVDEYASLAPTEVAEERKGYLAGFRNPYPFCMHMAMTTLGLLSRDKDGIQYFIEAGDKDQGQARNFIALWSSKQELGGVYHHRSNSLVSKAEAPLLATADILAWEWCRHVLRKKDDTRVRASLGVLLRQDKEDIRGRLGAIAKGRCAVHYGGESLREHLKDMQLLLKYDRREGPFRLRTMQAHGAPANSAGGALVPSRRTCRGIGD